MTRDRGRTDQARKGRQKHEQKRRLGKERRKGKHLETPQQTKRPKIASGKPRREADAEGDRLEHESSLKQKNKSTQQTAVVGVSPQQKRSSRTASAPTPQARKREREREREKRDRERNRKKEDRRTRPQKGTHFRQSRFLEGRQRNHTAHILLG